jgi:drug/metabolite transporter (DMT)-like permease
LALLPLLIWERKRNKSRPQFKIQQHLFPALLTGLVLFAGASFQQIGLLGTTAGKAGFITGLYVVLVPLMALLWGKRTHPAHWLGAVLAAVGLYFLSVQQGFTVAPYDLIVLAGAFIWAGHVHLIDRYVRKVGAVRLSILQFAICGLLSGGAALSFESLDPHGIIEGIWPILYGGILSVGVAYTLQVMAQRHADPAHATIILSLEGAFAALGGWLVLGEYLSIKEVIGLLLMMAGSILSISTVIMTNLLYNLKNK